MNNVCNRNLQMHAKLLQLLGASQEICNFEAKICEPGNLMNRSYIQGLKKKNLPEISSYRFISPSIMIINYRLYKMLCYHTSRKYFLKIYDENVLAQFYRKHAPSCNFDSSPDVL